MDLIDKEKSLTVASRNNQGLRSDFLYLDDIQPGPQKTISANMGQIVYLRHILYKTNQQ